MYPSVKEKEGEVKHLVLSMLFLGFALSARAQEATHEYDSGVRIPVERTQNVRNEEIIIVIGRRMGGDIPPAYERYLDEDPRSVEYDYSSGDRVVVYRYRFWGSSDGMALNLRNTTREDQHDRIRGIPVDVGRSGELVLCRFPPLRCLRVE